MMSRVLLVGLLQVVLLAPLQSSLPVALPLALQRAAEVVVQVVSVVQVMRRQGWGLQGKQPVAIPPQPVPAAEPAQLLGYTHCRRSL